MFHIWKNECHIRFFIYLYKINKNKSLKCMYAKLSIDCIKLDKFFYVFLIVKIAVLLNKVIKNWINNENTLFRY